MSIEQPTTPELEATPTPRRSARFGLAIGGTTLAGALVVGVVAGAVAMKYAGPRESMALLPPVAISAMANDSLVAVKGQAVEIFGNKFIIADATGRALIETGRAGEDGKLVAPNEAVTVQGRFDDGFVHALMVIHADGRVDELRPAPPPHHGAKGGPRHHGPGPEGPDPDGPDAAPRI